MKLFYEQECRLQILPQQYSLLSFLILRCSAPPLLSYTVILPQFRSFSLFCRRSPTHFSPVPATEFLCLFSCFPTAEKSQNNVSENIKTYIYKNKFISLFSYLSAITITEYFNKKVLVLILQYDTLSLHTITIRIPPP